MTTEPPDMIRQLPHSVSAEQSVIGTILTIPESAEIISEFLKPEHFALEENGEVFRKAIEKSKIGLADSVTMCGGIEPDKIKDYIKAAVTQKIAVEYAHHIKDCYLHRALVRIGEEITDGGYSDDDIDELLEASNSRLEGLQGDLPHISLSIKDSVSASILSVEQGQNKGIPTGFMDFDKMIGGLKGPDLIVLAGRPAMGKTSLALGIAHNVAKLDKTVAFFSLEMSAHQLNQRLFSMSSGVDLQRIWNSEIGEAEWPGLRKAAEELQGLPIHVDDQAAQTPSQIKMKAKKIQRKHGLDLVVVDYLQLAGAGERYQGQRVNEVSQLTAAFKGLAKELNVPVILLSQLSRAVESRESHRPKLSDLRDSGSIEQDADIVGFVYRHEYYLARSDKPIAPDKLEKHLAMLEDFKGKAELIIDKSRNGPTGTVPLYFDGGKTLFRGVAQ